MPQDARDYMDIAGRGQAVCRALSPGIRLHYVTIPFMAGGKDYAAYRPTYPAQLAEALAAVAPGRALAVDVGCGSGQLSVLLGDRFEAVAAFDPSESQLAGAAAHPRVHYAVASAEQLPGTGHSADLVTAAQAAHWFDRPRFYEEVWRIARPGAVVALITYNHPVGDDAALAPFRALYDALAPWWRPERRDVETGYACFEFPFDEFELNLDPIRREWGVDAMCAYVQTWSALRLARAAGEDAMIEHHLADARAAWGTETYIIEWPIATRIGRVTTPKHEQVSSGSP
jgi:SAM-dependent methyltransferase